MTAMEDALLRARPATTVEALAKSTIASTSFYFKKRREPINWRLLASINVEKLMKNADVQVLQDCIDSITFCDIEREDLRNVDPIFVKLFQLAQLTIEYLLHTQEYLEAKSKTVDQRSQDKNTTASDLEKKVQQQQKEIEQLSKENRQLKKTVYAFQLWSKIPGGMQQQSSAPAAVSYHRCRYCAKVFNTEYFLESHLLRRHPELPNYVAESNMPVPTFPQIAQKSFDGEMLDRITQTIERFSTRLIETERTLRTEMDKKWADELQRREDHIRQNYNQERLNYEKELMDLKTTMARQLEEERALLREERAAFEKIKTEVAKKSNIGPLENDDEEEKKRMHREEQALQRLEQRYDNAFGRLQDLVESEINQRKKQLDNREKQEVSTERKHFESMVADTVKKIGDLENVILQRTRKQSVSSIPKSPKKQVKEYIYTNQESWNQYLELMNDFKAISLPHNQMLRSCYKHTEMLVIGKRNELMVQLDNELTKRHINEDSIGNEKTVMKIKNSIDKDRNTIDRRYPYNERMRQHILDEMDRVAAAKFRYKPTVPPIVIPQRNHSILLSAKSKFPRSPTSSSSKLASPSRMTTRSNQSLNSETSDINWDETNSVLSDSISDVSYTNSDKSDTSQTSNSEEPKSALSKAWSAMRGRRRSTASNVEKRKPSSRRASVQDAVGHVPDVRSKKNPLERRKDSNTDMEPVSTTGRRRSKSSTSSPSDNLSELLQDIRAEMEPNAVQRGRRRSIDELSDVQELETEHLS